MTARQPARTTTRRTRIRRGRVAGLLVLVAAIAAALGSPLMASTPATWFPTVAEPEGAAVVGKEPPGVANLDSDLLGAIRQAATDAAGDGVEVSVNSGWRSAEDQARGDHENGSPREAARWVATPDTSAHVSGDAVDIGPAEAAAWLSKHGAAYGLCQVYGNEPWHYERRPEAVDHGCPPVYADPSHDPRMQP